MKSADGKVIMDGYILVHISGTPDVEPDNIEIANLPLEDVKHFDLCDSEDDWVFEVDWAEFSDYGLTQTLNNMTKRLITSTSIRSSPRTAMILLKI